MLKNARNRYVLFQILAKRGKRSPTPEKSCSRSHIPKNRENREIFNPTGRTVWTGLTKITISQIRFIYNDVDKTL